MQTKRQIRDLLSSAGVSPNKRLGQHFLIDLNLMRLLVDSANIQESDVILEVGCGTGSMTEALAEKAGRVIAVELDKNLSEIAANHLVKSENVEIINTDILESKNTLSQTVIKALAHAVRKCPGRILLISNLPYNAASPVMMNLATGPTTADGMYVTVQKEVADRMIAVPASDSYGILSILLGATGRVKTFRTMKPAVFWPQPQVDSAMVSFVRDNEKSRRIANMEILSETVHLFMGHRRKTLLACSKLARGRLAKITNWPEIFEQCRISSTQRPETLAPEDYINITNYAIN